MSEKIFADGFYFSRREDAPDFVIGKQSIQVEKAIAFLKKHANEKGYVEIDLLYGRSGNPYCQLNTFVPTKQDESGTPDMKDDAEMPSKTEEEEDDLPF